LKNLRKEIDDLESQLELRKAQLLLVEITQEKVLTEMKAYVGGDADLELIQRRRGFTTYRDLYNKKIADLELQIKKFRERLQELQVLFIDCE
jgi:intraflagellar transport protein 81